MDSIYYDLEGPISGQDNAQALCKKYVKDGEKLFSVVSRYDDILTLANWEGYEPGDTLALIIPFLIEAGVTEDDVRAVSAEASLVKGIAELFAELQEEGCLIWIISTSYEQHALSIAERIGVPVNQVYCTKFPLNQLRAEIGKENLSWVREFRQKAVDLYQKGLEHGKNDEAILSLFDLFYWIRFPKTKLGQAVSKIQVNGGRRKVQSLQKAIIASDGYSLGDAFIVVDSITDRRMAESVEEVGGIALAWNANQFVLPWCSCAVAALDARTVRPVFKAWQKGGPTAVREFIEWAPEPKNAEIGPYYHWLAGRDESFQREVLEIHLRLRKICRGAEIAKLG